MEGFVLQVLAEHLSVCVCEEKVQHFFRSRWNQRAASA